MSEEYIGGYVGTDQASDAKDHFANTTLKGKKRADARKRLSFLGATGSIGESAFSVIRDHPERFDVAAVAGGRNLERLIEIAREFRPRLVSFQDETKVDDLKAALHGLKCDIVVGPEAALEVAAYPVDLCVSSIVGFAGLEPTLTALSAADTVALANKESLVCAGGYVMSEAKRLGVDVLPMDSEHNAIYQCVNGVDYATISAITITASGGPFRTWSRDEIALAKPEQALRHPNWSMGAKITIDSASLMNKGLELIEAHHFFPIDPGQLKVVVHPQSIIHGMVSFVDGAVLAELGTPDMRTPIAHCLAHPERVSTKVEPLDLARIGSLTFEEPDYQRFPMLDLALSALKEGDIATNLLNGANEVVVGEFLRGTIGFYQMSDTVAGVLDRGLTAFRDISEVASFEVAREIDQFAREEASALISQS